MDNSNDEEGSDPRPRSSDPKLERNALRATIEALGLSRKSIAWTAAGVAVAIIAIFVTILTGDGGTRQENASGPNVNINGDNNSFEGLDNYLQKIPDGAPADVYRQEAQQYTSIDPPGAGPWAFVVVADPALGLKVRSSSEVQATQLGSAAFGTAVWVDCQRDSGFNAGESSGSIWYRIAWPSSQSTMKFYNSSPGDPRQGWVYNGLVVPAGHNGKVPTCQG